MARAPFRPRHRNDFKIAIICALPLEAEMVELVFDEFWDDHGERYGKALGDQNTYTTGIIGAHNVVLTYMPGIGSNSAAIVAAGLRSSFRGIEITFVVGICGAVPYTLANEEIVLGDCIISTAVVQYDFGRQYPSGFIRKHSVEDSLGRASLEIRSLTAMLMTRRNRRRLIERLGYHLQVLQDRESDVEYPGAERDRLFEPSYAHEHRDAARACNLCLIGSTICLKDCDSINCQNDHLVARKRLSNSSGSVTIESGRNGNLVSPMIHFGRFGSANTVMKSGLDRDLIAQDGGVIAFEMEGSGVWDTFPTIVVKSACDYADSHKSKEWQVYAAATAAAGLKALLEKWETSEDTFREVSTEQNMGSSFYSSAATTVVYSEANSDISTGESSKQEDIEIMQQPENPRKDALKLLLDRAARNEEDCLYAEAETCYEQILSIRESDLGPKHLETLCTLDNLGQVCSKQYMYEKAAEYFNKALQAKEEALGSDHESTLTTVHNLGLLLKAQDKFGEAEAMSVRALLDRERVLGSQHISTLETVDSLGVLYRHLDKFGDSEKLLLRALHGKEKIDGAQQITILDTLSHLGDLYRYLKRFDDAERVCIRALEGHEKIHGMHHRSTSQALYDLGAVYSKQKKLDRAQEIFARADKIRELMPKTAFMMMGFGHDLGAFYSRQHKTEEAEEMLIKVLKARKSVLGSKHTAVLAVVNSLACVYDQQGKYPEAEILFQQALEGYEAVVGTEHTWTSRVLRNLGWTFEKQKHLDKAEELYTRALLGYKKGYGMNHKSTLDAAFDLGDVYYKQEKMNEAQKMYMQAQQGFEQLFGEIHKSTVTSCQSLALVYCKQGNLTESEKTYERALNGFKTLYGPTHKSTLDTTYDLGNIYYRQNKLDAAEAMFLQALQGYERQFGAEYKATLDSTRNLAHVYRKKPDLKLAERYYSKALLGYRKTLGDAHILTISTSADLDGIYRLLEHNRLFYN